MNLRIQKISAAFLALSLGVVCASCSRTSAPAQTDTTLSGTAAQFAQTEAASSSLSETVSAGTAESAAAPTSAAPQTTAAPQASSSLSFADLPSEFFFTSGVGAWGTTIRIRPDGTFDGEYHDSDLGVKTMYYSTFNGKFSQPQKRDANSCTVRLERLDVTNDLSLTDFGIDPDTEVNYVESEPYGLEGVTDMVLYLPGTPIAQIPEECMPWLHLYEDTDVLPKGTYALFDPAAGNAFVGNQ